MKKICFAILLSFLIVLSGGTLAFAEDYIDGGVHKDLSAPLLTETVTYINTYDGTVGNPMFFRLIPTVTDYFTIETTGTVDTEGELYDALGNSLEVRDDVVGSNFQIHRELIGGETYYLRVTNYTMIAGDQTTLRITGDAGGLLAGLAPAISSIVASDAGSNAGLGIGDTVAITFDQNTNKPSITAATIDSKLKLNNGHSWGSALADGDIAWNAAGNILTITFSSVTGSTIAVGDTITLDATANIKDSGGTTSASTDNEPVTGSFADSTAPTVTITAGATAGGDALVNVAEKASGFNVVAQSSEATGTLYVVPSGTANNIPAITAAAIGSAASAGANTDTTIAISANNVGVINGISYEVYAVDAAGNISEISGVAFTAELAAPAGYSAVIDQVAINNANKTAMSFTFAGAEVGATYNYTVTSSGGAGNVSGSGTINNASQQITGINVSGLADGTLTLSVTLTDAAGNTGTASTYTVSKDAANAAPTATVQPITGTLQAGKTLTGHYTYSDVNGDLEGTSTYKWYRSDNAAGLNKTPIAGATSKTYVLQSADEGKYISFEVTPVAATGTLQGTAVESALTGPVAAAAYGSFSFSSAAYSVAENGGSVTITVNRTGGSDGAVTVDYAIINGTATAGSDYTAPAATLSFGNGETSKTFTVSILDDSVYEGDETVNLTLSNPTGGAVLGETSSAVLTITDNEAAPLVDITAASVTIAVPVLGAVPQNAAAVEAATNNPDYTVTGLVWNEALTMGNKFKAGQVYTATVTLTSKNGKKFQDAAFTPTVAGSASVGTTTTAGGAAEGNTVSFTVNYAATGALAVSSIAVTTQPTKMSYTETTDAVLALNGLQVTETNNDGSTNVVTFADGTAAGYTANPANGASLTNAAHNGNPVVITHTASAKIANTGNLTVQDAPVANAAAPVITNNLSTAQVEYSQNATAAALDATATVTDGGTISYAWHSNTTSSTVGATSLGVTTATYTPSTATAGTTYYFCVVTNTNNAASGTTTAQTTSAIANIKVNAAGGGGSGHSSTGSNTPVITVSEVKSELFSNAGDIKVEADVNSAFGQSVAVKITDDTDSQKEIFSLAGANDRVYPFDISLHSKTSNEKIQPKDGYSVKITLPLPKELLDDREKIKVVYGKDGKLETLKSELAEKDGKWYITFEATHFSPYALIVSDEKPAQPETAPWANPFSDVKASDWYYAAVQYAAQNGLMKGTGSNNFSPELVTNRGMIATILYNLDGSGDAEQSTFKDVKPGAYYANAVAWAQKKGIIAGYGNGMFGPDDSITREQLAAMLWKYAGSPAAADSKVLASFKDTGEISAYAQNALAWANQKGIINGKGGGLLDPKGKATRGEAAQIMQNFLQKSGLMK